MIKIEGMEDEIRKLSLLDKVYDQEILREANRIGIDVRDDVRANTPVDTGELKRSTKFEGSAKIRGDVIIKVYNNLDYADHIEYGHRQEVGKYIPAIGKRLKKGFVKGYYMFRDAENNIRPEIDSRVAQAIRKADDRLNK